MLSRLLRKWSPDLLRPVVALLLQAGITANQLTLGGLIAAVIAGALVANGQTVAGGLILLLSRVLDALDGGRARPSGSASPYGCLLDSIAGHYRRFAVYLG